MKTAKMTDFIEPFSINENCCKKGKLYYHFYRVFPPNLSTMTPREKLQKINEFYNLLHNIKFSLNCTLQIIAMDAAENLKANINCIKQNTKKQYDYIRDDIISEISKSENQNNAIQRAFYLVLTSEKSIESNSLDVLAKDILLRYEKLDKKEIIAFFRSFFLREFDYFDISSIEQSANKIFENQENNKKAKKKDKKPKEIIYAQELLKRILPTKMAAMPDYISQGNFLRQILLVKNMPASFENLCLLQRVAQLEKSSMNIRITEMNEATAKRLADQQLKAASSDQVFTKGVDQVEAKKDAKNIEEFYSKFIDDEDRIFYVNIFIEIYGKDEQELSLMRDRVSTRLNPITFEVLRFDMIDGFKGVFPLGDDLFKTLSNNIPGRTLSALYPFSYSSRNDKDGILLGKTEDGGQFFIDFWLRDKTITNGSFFISGESGQGKSYTMKKIISQLISRGYNIFIIDNENEYSDLIKVMGGTNIDTISGSFMINPFEVRCFGESDEDDQTESIKSGSQFFQHLSWLQEFFQVLYPNISSKQLSTLMILVKDLYGIKSIDDNTNFSKLLETDYPTFTDLYEYIEKVITNKDKYQFYKMISTQELYDILILLKDVFDGSLSPLFNGHTKLINDNIINFNIQRLLMGSSQRTQAYLFSMITYLWSRIVLKENRTLLAIDELYLLCNPKNMIIVQYLRDFVKRFRKYDAILGISTQQIIDCTSPALYNYTAALINSPAFKFVFNLGDTDYDIVRKFLNLTDGEIEKIRNAQKKHCLVKAGSTDKYMLNVGTLPYEKDLFGQAGGR